MDSKLIWRIMAIIISLGVVAFVWSITISPIEFVRFERDRQRSNDIYDLVEILNKIEKESPQALKGEPKLVYTSLPDNNPSCSSWQLPQLADGFSYRCASFVNYRRANGAGWLPVEMPLSQLPIDPLNGKKIKDQVSGKQKIFFYQYIKGSFVVGASLEGLESQQGASQLSGNNRSRRIELIVSNKKLSEVAILFHQGIIVVGSVEKYIASLPEPKQQELASQIARELTSFVDGITKNESEQKLWTKHFLNQLFELDLPLSQKEREQIKLKEIAVVRKTSDIAITDEVSSLRASEASVAISRDEKIKTPDVQISTPVIVSEPEFTEILKQVQDDKEARITYLQNKCAQQGSNYRLVPDPNNPINGVCCVRDK